MDVMIVHSVLAKIYGAVYNKPFKNTQTCHSSATPSGRSHFFHLQEEALDKISPAIANDFSTWTPSLEREILKDGGTRCVCKNTDGSGKLMIQCESCTMWLHAVCVGLSRRNLPPVYICSYCVQTPNMRGGRVRPSAFSPLAHKSGARK